MGRLGPASPVTSEDAFEKVIKVLEERVTAHKGGPFAVLLRGDGPDVPGVHSLD